MIDAAIDSRIRSLRERTSFSSVAWTHRTSRVAPPNSDRPTTSTTVTVRRNRTELATRTRIGARPAGSGGVAEGGA